MIHFLPILLLEYKKEEFSNIEFINILVIKRTLTQTDFRILLLKYVEIFLTAGNFWFDLFV